MARTTILRKDLERIALQEIRSFPGAEHAISVEIEYPRDQRHEVEWKFHVIATDDANLERIQYAARTTSERLRRRYALEDEP